MPHAPIYQMRPERRPVTQFRVIVCSAEGRSQFDIPACDAQGAKREALRLYANEHDTPITAWAEVH